MVKEKKITGIKSWPADDRPREKLLKKGAGALSNSELLAILLRTGTQGTSAIDLARKILKKFSTFRNMAHTDARDWKEFKGLGGAKIAHIQAALEIGRRYREDDVSTGKQKIASAKDVVDIVMPQLRDLKNGGDGSLAGKVDELNAKIREEESRFRTAVSDNLGRGKIFSFETLSNKFKLESYEKRVLLFFLFLEFFHVMENLCMEMEILELMDLENSPAGRIKDFKYIKKSAGLLRNACLSERV